MHDSLFKYQYHSLRIQDSPSSIMIRLSPIHCSCTTTAAPALESNRNSFSFTDHVPLACTFNPTNAGNSPLCASDLATNVPSIFNCKLLRRIPFSSSLIQVAPATYSFICCAFGGIKTELVTGAVGTSHGFTTCKDESCSCTCDFCESANVCFCFTAAESSGLVSHPELSTGVVVVTQAQFNAPAKQHKRSTTKKFGLQLKYIVTIQFILTAYLFCL